MDLNALEEMMAEEPGSAEAAIAELAANSNVDELGHVAKSARVPGLAEAAIEALGDIGGDEAVAVLVELAQSTNKPFVEGGTEQKIEQQRLRSHVVQSLARARGVAPPAGRSQEDVAEFIESVRNS